MENLPTKYNPAEVEARLYAQWESAGYFHADPARGGTPHTIVIPPPNVTGVLHIGHALNNTLQDILTRFRRMQGRNALWMPGTDHAGIATQHVVERKLRAEKIDPRALGREKFIEKVWEWKEHHGSTIIRQLKTLGCSCDWERERFTMDAGLSRAVRVVFKRLFDEGLIYRGDYMVNWSPKLQTALSDDEVEYREVDGRLWHFRYPYADGSGHAVVATTRPETMLGDTAVAVNPEDERYKSLIGKKVTLPLMNRPIPIIADPFVDKNFGTGMVKVTPAHDPNDYEMGKRHGLQFINLLHPDGRLNEHAGAYAGLEIAVARKRVVADMESAGLVEKIEPHRHSVGHCYRSGCVIEPYISKQWFVKIRPLAEPALEAVKSGRTEFVPKSWENTYFRWMENVRDWCISRQLWWGHRIPVFVCEDCGHVECTIEETVERCPECDSGRMNQDPDVLDTWFSSALWPFSTLGWPEETPELKFYYPTSVLVTGHDIIFFWVARMMMMGLKFMGDIPFRQVYITPLIMDEQGAKMSKSKGNVVDPLELVKANGADATRMTLAAYAAQSRQVALSMKRFEGYRNFTNKLWNAARFVLMNTADLTAEDFAAGIAKRDLALEDRWILSELRRTCERATAALEAYEFDQYVSAIYDFTWKQYCDWYLELVKRRLYAKEEAGTAQSRRTAQIVLINALETLLRLLHPVAPFITEEIYRRGKGAFSKADSLMIAPWPDPASTGERDLSAEAEIALLQEVVYLVRNIRGEMGVAPGTKTDVEVTTANAERLERLRRCAPYFRSLVNLGELTINASATNGAAFVSTGVFEDVTVSVPLPSELREQESKRLLKELARIEAEIGRIQSKLANENFVAHAPAEVVEKERKRLSALQEELSSIRSKSVLLG